MCASPRSMGAPPRSWDDYRPRPLAVALKSRLGRRYRISPPTPCRRATSPARRRQPHAQMAAVLLGACKGPAAHPQPAHPLFRLGKAIAYTEAQPSSPAPPPLLGRDPPREEPRPVRRGRDQRLVQVYAREAAQRVASTAPVGLPAAGCQLAPPALAHARGGAGRCHPGRPGGIPLSRHGLHRLTSSMDASATDERGPSTERGGPNGNDHNAPRPVAIVGIAAVMPPGPRRQTAFWDNIKVGRFPASPTCHPSAGTRRSTTTRPLPGTRPYSKIGGWVGSSTGTHPVASPGSPDRGAPPDGRGPAVGGQRCPGGPDRRRLAQLVVVDSDNVAVIWAMPSAVRSTTALDAHPTPRGAQPPRGLPTLRACRRRATGHRQETRATYLDNQPSRSPGTPYPVNSRGMSSPAGLQSAKPARLTFTTDAACASRTRRPQRPSTASSTTSTTRSSPVASIAIWASMPS